MRIELLIALYVTFSWRATEAAAVAVKQNAANNNEPLFPLSIIHINDFHARFEETSEQSTRCIEGEKCIGGYARAVTVVKQLLERHKNTNPIYLNAGDNFQGTLWYSIGRWNVTSYFLNLLSADAITLGNHDFDHGVAGVVPFLETLESPVIVANMDDTDEPTIQGKYKKYIVIERSGRKIGIIGVTMENISVSVSNTEKLRFQGEGKTVRKEADKLNKQGVDIIIVLSHCGLDADYVIAKEAGPYIDVIVGGHSHTFMYTVPKGGTAPGPDVVRDKYPAVVTQEDGHRVLIVQASAYMKYVGDLTVFFDKDGVVDSWDGAPIYLDTDIVPDPEIVHELQPWKEQIDAKGLEVVGKTNVILERNPCSWQECELGDLVTDAFAHYYTTLEPNNADEERSPYLIALLAIGSIRNILNIGPITYSDVAAVIPFEDTVDSFELRGVHIKEIFEHAVSSSWKEDKFVGKWMIQISGLKVVFNMTNEINNRVDSIDVLRRSGKPTDANYEPLDPLKYYRCIAQDFLSSGGDGFNMISENKRHQKIGPIDIDIIVQYLKERKVIDGGLDGRITFLEAKDPNKDSGSSQINSSISLYFSLFFVVVYFKCL